MHTKPFCMHTQIYVCMHTNIPRIYVCIHKYMYACKTYVCIQNIFVCMQKYMYAYKESLYAYKDFLYAYKNIGGGTPSRGTPKKGENYMTIDPDILDE